MSASKKAKQRGLASLKEMAELTDTPVTTLTDWVKTRPKRFDALILGAVEIKKRKADV